ncbi:MAG: NAD-dependent epimerase/dehydratase family protein [Betaproteobacteria bacterium]|nr:NAD-dependent epimerase/dehydratase family protein [Betaproteobacteria bacterium]
MHQHRHHRARRCHPHGGGGINRQDNATTGQGFADNVGGKTADFDLGMRVNLDGIRNLLQAARAQAKPIRLLFASSIAVFGGELPEVVRDETTPTPQGSYGIQKYIGEQLVQD